MVLGPGFVALGVAEAGFVLPEDFVPVEASGLDAVFLDQEPTICSRVSRRVWAVQAREWALQRVVDRGGSLEASGHQGLGTLVERWIPAFAGMTRSAPARRVRHGTSKAAPPAAKAWWGSAIRSATWHSDLNAKSPWYCWGGFGRCAETHGPSVQRAAAPPSPVPPKSLHV